MFVGLCFLGFGFGLCEEGGRDGGGGRGGDGGGGGVFSVEITCLYGGGGRDAGEGGGGGEEGEVEGRGPVL